MLRAFQQSGIGTFTIGDNDLGNVSTFSQAFYSSSLKSFGTEANPISFGSRNGADMTALQAFYSASSLTDFFITDSARITSLQQTFEGSGLVNFGSSTTPVGLGSTADNTSTVDLYRACYQISSLKEAHIDSGNRIGRFREAFQQSGITTFRIGDNDLSNVTDMTNAFTNGSLDVASIENILVSCDNGGKSSITLNMNGGTNAAKSTWSGIATVAYDNLVAKSWSITFNA
jgi:hypothetical protein